MLVKLSYKKKGFLILCYYLFTHSPHSHHFSEVFLSTLVRATDSSVPELEMDGSLEEEKAVEKQNTQTQTRLGMRYNERWSATESNIRLPLAKLLSTSLSLKMSFKVSRAIHAKASY